ncbi:MAG: ATP-binding protein [Methanomicrobiales archaeon]|nr:ATP-binding protein [Methanomicrobiales archaeon]
MSGESEVQRIMEIVLTAEIFNQYQQLDINDLTPTCREIFRSDVTTLDVKRPVSASDGRIKASLGIADAHKKVSANPFVSVEEFGQRMKITALEPAAQRFLSEGGISLTRQNPVLAFYLEKLGSENISYKSAREANLPCQDTKAHLDARLSRLIGEDEKLRNALDLVIINAPEEVEQDIGDLVCTEEQLAIVRKIQHSIEHRDFLHRHRIYEIGKLLFVGPPGTGKTSMALALSRTMHMPILEVRLSMITSQYLGETSKNIDRIFELAKKLSPAILFIDEFDFVAKSRTADDHGAMKRAVNSLLKNIDKINLIKNGVLLIGATNHPQLLDDAAWRRFDEVIEFALPDEEMRRNILKTITSSLHCSIDYQALAKQTEGFSGADLRMMIKEAILSALMDKRQTIGPADIKKGIEMVRNREAIRHQNWI